MKWTPLKRGNLSGNAGGNPVLAGPRGRASVETLRGAPMSGYGYGEEKVQTTNSVLIAGRGNGSGTKIRWRTPCGFESHRGHQLFQLLMWPCSLMVRTLAFQARDAGFNSRQGHQLQYEGDKKWVERSFGLLCLTLLVRESLRVLQLLGLCWLR